MSKCLYPNVQATEKVIELGQINSTENRNSAKIRRRIGTELRFKRIKLEALKVI